MFAKQTTTSASLVAVLGVCVSVRRAHAEPAPRAPSGTFEVGAGYSSYEGFIARSRIEQSDLFGTGHYLALDARISEMRQDYLASYATAESAGGLRLRAELLDSTRTLPAFTRHSASGTITLEQRLAEHLHAFAGIRDEEVMQPLDLHLVVLRAGMVYETERTTVGMSYELSDRRFGSDATFDRMHVWGAHHQPIGPLTLHVRGDALQMMGAVPESERVFVDGLTDARGFAPGSIAPLGGTTKVSGSVEIEIPLWKKIGLSAVGFADATGIGDKNGLAFGESVGAGLQLKTPVGTLRLDYAVPIDGGGAPRILLGFGSPF